MQEKTKILIVDDDPLIGEAVRVLFEAEGKNYEVMGAADALTGLDSAARNLPHLIICDVMMPRLSGFDFIAAIRTNSDIRHIPILICSATQPSVERQCLELGANAYLVKPVAFEILRRKAKDLLGHPS